MWARIRIIIGISLSLLFLNCTGGSKSGLVASSDAGAESSDEQFPPVFNYPKSDYADTLDAKLVPELGEGGSGENGEITSTDKRAIMEVTDELMDLAPPEWPTIPEELRGEVNQVVKDTAAGKDTSQLRFLLSAKLMNECSKSVVALAPQPGQPLLGVWEGYDSEAGCAASFEVVGGGDLGGGASSGLSTSGSMTLEGSSSSTLTVIPGAKSGVMIRKAFYWDGITGSLAVSPDGSATLSGTANSKAKKRKHDATTSYSGRLMDQPYAGSGTLNRSSGGKKIPACATRAQLIESRNPIPENYTEAMKRAGACFRRALFMTGPLFDIMLTKVDPKIGPFLMMGSLGSFKSSDGN